MTNREKSRAIVGRTITRVEWRAFRTERSGHEWSTDPVFHLSDGTTLTFNAAETEVGTYGVEVSIWRP